jgi:predicted ABC-type sugar transport system permease subunit
MRKLIHCILLHEIGMAGCSGIIMNFFLLALIIVIINNKREQYLNKKFIIILIKCICIILSILIKKQ